jgi:hypothetical protein
MLPILILSRFLAATRSYFAGKRSREVRPGAEGRRARRAYPASPLLEVRRGVPRPPTERRSYRPGLTAPGNQVRPVLSPITLAS